MDVVYRYCAGVDVHKKTIAVNMLRRGMPGKEDRDEVRTSATMTRDLLVFTEWLDEEPDART